MLNIISAVCRLQTGSGQVTATTTFVLDLSKCRIFYKIHLITESKRKEFTDKTAVRLALLEVGALHLREYLWDKFIE